MKTWEMIKELTANPDKEFISYAKKGDRDVLKTKSVNGAIRFSNEENRWHEVLIGVDLDREWEEVAIEAQTNQQWIPISESLPETADLYLVQTDSKTADLYLVQTDSKYGGSDGKGAMDIDRFSFDEDGNGYWTYWPNSHSGKTQVIAWMPLPESYKE